VQIPTYAVLLFGARLRSDAYHGGLTIDAPGVPPGCALSLSPASFDASGLKFKAWSRIAVLANALRRLLDAELAMRIDEPSVEGTSSPVVTAMLALLERDGR